jgi:hypothetical protein
MTNKSNIQNEILATINSLDGITSASPGPFFFTRLQARLNKVEKNGWEKMSAFVSRPAVAIAMVTFVLLMNTFAVLQHKKSSSLALDQSEQSVYEEFNVAANTFYDYEIKEP